MFLEWFQSVNIQIIMKRQGKQAKICCDITKKNIQFVSFSIWIILPLQYEKETTLYNRIFANSPVSRLLRRYYALFPHAPDSIWNHNTFPSFQDSAFPHNTGLHYPIHSVNGFVSFRHNRILRDLSLQNKNRRDR